MRPELEQAVALLRKSDPQSVQEAIGLLQNTVFSFSMKVCGDREDAEDTMQDVLVSSLPHLAKLRDPRALSVWLYTVAKRRCWRNRRGSIHARYKTIALDDLMPDEKELSLLRAGTEISPETRSMRKENSLLVHSAVLQLPSQYRIVLVLHDMEDLDTAQIAEVLSLQPGTIRVRLHRARLLVRRELAKPLTQRSHKTPARKAGKTTADPRKLPTCGEIFANLSEYLDGRIEPKSCSQMQAHIEACPQCVLFIRDLKRAIDRCRSLNLPLGADIGLSLRRQLTDEYLRLLRNRSQLILSISVTLSLAVSLFW